MANTRKSRRKRPGHYCWCCDRRRANERFSGKGHRQHLCRDCARLGGDELQYRQAMRNLGRLVTWGGILPRKKRRPFQKFLEHPSPRVREQALEILVIDARQRAELALLDEADDFATPHFAIATTIVATTTDDATIDALLWADAREAPW